MLKSAIKIVNPLGLHARAAAQLVKTASKFKSTIVLRRDAPPGQANARSMLDLLSLAASVNTAISVEAAGVDEEEALQTVENLITSGFGEI